MLKIAYGKSCESKFWQNSEIEWSDLSAKIRNRNGFVGGFLKDGGNT